MSTAWRRGRRGRGDLLTRPPASARVGDRWLETLVSDPVAQIHELADLAARGFLSPREFEELKARLLRNYRDEPRRDSESSRARAAASARDPTPNFR